MRVYNKILAHVPHSSIQDYPFGWLSSMRLFPVVKERTDWHTEIMFHSSNPKVDVMVFPHSRFYVDVERIVDDTLKTLLRHETTTH